MQVPALALRARGLPHWAHESWRRSPRGREAAVFSRGLSQELKRRGVGPGHTRTMNGAPLLDRRDLGPGRQGAAFA